MSSRPNCSAVSCSASSDETHKNEAGFKRCSNDSASKTKVDDGSGAAASLSRPRWRPWHHPGHCLLDETFPFEWTAPHFDVVHDARQLYEICTLSHCSGIGTVRLTPSPVGFMQGSTISATFALSDCADSEGVLLSDSNKPRWLPCSRQRMCKARHVVRQPIRDSMRGLLRRLRWRLRRRFATCQGKGQCKCCAPPWG